MISLLLLARLFHGTTSSNAASIRAKGFKPSTTGRLGSGVYLTVRESAVAIAEHRGGDANSVIEVDVDLGRVKILPGSSTESSTVWSSQGYRSCRTEHPGWAGCGPFPEWCVHDPSRVKVVGVRENDLMPIFYSFCLFVFCVGSFILLQKLILFVVGWIFYLVLCYIFFRIFRFLFF